MAGLVYFFSIRAFSISAIVTAKIVYLGFLVSYISKVTLIIYSFLYSFLFKFSIRYKVGIRFRLKSFKYSFYS